AVWGPGSRVRGCPGLPAAHSSARASHAAIAAGGSSVGPGPAPVPPALGGSSPTSSTPPASTRQRQPPSHRATTELVCGLPMPRSAVTGGASSRYADGARGPRGRDLHGRDRRGAPPPPRAGPPPPPAAPRPSPLPPPPPP